MSQSDGKKHLQDRCTTCQRHVSKRSAFRVGDLAYCKNCADRLPKRIRARASATRATTWATMRA